MIKLKVFTKKNYILKISKKHIGPVKYYQFTLKLLDYIFVEHDYIVNFCFANSGTMLYKQYKTPAKAITPPMYPKYEIDMLVVITPPSHEPVPIPKL